MIDFIPLLISFYENDIRENNSWVHPNIDQLCKFKKYQFEEDDDDDTLWCHDAFRVYLKGIKGIVYIVFKSDWFEKKESVSEDALNNKIYLTDEEIEMLHDAISDKIFIGDWKVNGETFASTTFSIAMKNYLGKGSKLSYLSPDVAISKETNGTYSWSS